MEVDNFTPPKKNTQSLFDSDIDTEYSPIAECPLFPRSQTETGYENFTVNFLNGY